MRYKALILDLDGTTIPNRLDGTPSEAVTKAIRHVRDKIHICIATGRNIEIVTPILEHLELSGPCILRNGAQIYDPQTQKMIKEVFIPYPILKSVFTILKKYHNKWFTAPASSDAVELFENLLPRKDEKIFNIFAGDMTLNQADKLEKELAEMAQIRMHRMESWTKDLIAVAISHADASKQHGILEVARLLRISPAEIIGVGDSYNDFPLLMACGLKFAMGNAVPELKAIADFIAPPVDQDGVAVIIEKFILPLLEN